MTDPLTRAEVTEFSEQKDGALREKKRPLVLVHVSVLSELQWRLVSSVTLRSSRRIMWIPCKYFQDSLCCSLLVHWGKQQVKVVSLAQ